MGPLVCPEDKTFAGFFAGRLDPSERDLLVAHVDACSRCAQILAIPDSPTLERRSGLPDGAVVATFRPGAVLASRYCITRLLGIGGMGEVYEAFDLSLNARVALKTVRATIADDQRAIERFKSEVLLARRVTHPNVCRIFDFGVHHPDGASDTPVPFLTMELLDGGTLANHIREQRPFSSGQVIDVAQQLAAALLAAHRVNVIHKDLKAENVMLVSGDDGTLRAVVTDFGLAATRALAEGGPHGAPRFSGTPGYVAPERLAGAPANEACDVFSLGVVILDMLTGALPGGRAQRSVSVGGNGALHALAERCRAGNPRERPSLADLTGALAKLGRPPRPRGARAFRWAVPATVAVAVLAVVAVVAAIASLGRARGLSGAGADRGPAALAPPPVRGPSPGVVASPLAPVLATMPAVPPAPPPSRRRPPARSPKAGAMAAPPAAAAPARNADLLRAAEEELSFGRFSEACALGRAAAETAPETPAIWEFLGRCYMRLAQPREARGYYRRYLSLSPDGRRASFIRAIVARSEP